MRGFYYGVCDSTVDKKRYSSGHCQRNRAVRGHYVTTANVYNTPKYNYLTRPKEECNYFENIDENSVPVLKKKKKIIIAENIKMYVFPLHANNNNNNNNRTAWCVPRIITFMSIFSLDNVFTVRIISVIQESLNRVPFPMHKI